MMSQPRFRCLYATRQVLQGSLGVREFSRSSIARAEDQPPRRSSGAAGVLAAADPYTSSPQDTIDKIPQQTAPITLPRRAARTIPSAASQGSILRLMSQTAEKQRRATKSIGTNQRGGATTAEQLQEQATAQALSRQITRRWKAGDVYAPKDLSAVEMAKWKNRGRPERDVFDVLQFDPMEHYKNFSVMSEYMTPMGRIKHGKETGLRPVNQRRIARAIRRVVGMGMMPSVHRHPELLHKSAVRSEALSPNMRGPQ